MELKNLNQILNNITAERYERYVHCHRNSNGAEIHQATTTVSIDDLTRSVATDLDSNGVTDRINTHVLVNNGDGIGEAANVNYRSSDASSVLKVAI
jgi:hypothetical protein